MTIANESESNENTRRPRLSAKDARALAFVLDPHGEKALVDASSVSCGTNVVISGTDNAPQEALAPIAQHLRASLAARERAIVERCKDAVASASSSAESRHVVIHEEAVVAFSQLIDECPEYASALVNR